MKPIPLLALALVACAPSPPQPRGAPAHGAPIPMLQLPPAKGEKVGHLVPWPYDPRIFKGMGGFPSPPRKG